MKYVCNECGAVFNEIPRVYRGFSGDHFGGSETMLPGCTQCGRYDFAQHTDEDYENMASIRGKLIDEIKQGLNLEVVIISDDLGNNGYRCEDLDALIRRVGAKP